MKVEYLPYHCTEPSQRLLLIFAGWGSDASIARKIERADFHVAVAYDYSAEGMTDADLSRISQYGEIMVLAWSYGVAAAAIFMHAHKHLPFSVRIAVNGTHTPVDALTGISPAIFQGTLERLSEMTLQKFQRRMCGSAEAYKRYCEEMLPQRSVDSLRAELKYLGSLSAGNISSGIWDIVYLSQHDMIIPAESQRRAWGAHHCVRVTDWSHLPDFAQIVSNEIANKHYLTRRFAQTAGTYESHARVQQLSAAELAKMIGECAPPPGPVLEIGSGSGLFTRLLQQCIPTSELTLWDLTPIPDDLPGNHLQCDAETEIKRLAPGSMSLIAAASVIQWFDSPPRFMEECARALRPGGVLAVVTYGPDTYASIRDFTAGFKPRYYSVAQWHKILSPHFSISKIVRKTHRLEFADSHQLARHISLTGVNASTPATSSIRRLLRSGIRTLEYQPIFILAVAK